MTETTESAAMNVAGGQMRVLMVDDSAVMRQTLAAILGQEPDIDVSVAADPIIAQDKMARERPDVIVLDLEMPRIDKLTFLRRLIETDPMPIVVCSDLTMARTEHA